MNKGRISILMLSIILAVIQVVVINIKKEEFKMYVEKVTVSYEDIHESLKGLENLNIKKQIFKGDEILIEVQGVGNGKDITHMGNNLNKNKFISKVNNFKMVKHGESWAWESEITFSSYEEYRNFHKNE